MFDLDQMDIPIIAAPMAGGPSTVALVSAVGGAGGLGFLAAGYKSPEAVAKEIIGVRERTPSPFGVNVFIPQPRVDPITLADYRDELLAEARRYDVEIPEADPSDDDRWDEKLALLVEAAVPVVSFTFDAPPARVVDDLHRAGTYVVATVTTPAEARASADRGVDALCVQGPEAGAHRGGHDPIADPDSTPLSDLLAHVRDEVRLPLIAAGGLCTGADIAKALRAGARAVQAGTAYLRTPESGAPPAYKAALADPRFATTAVTRSFSGRPARGLRNRFIDAHDATAPPGYPMINQLTRPLRAAAAARGDADGLALWAGIGYRHATDEPAATVTRRLWAESS